MEQGRRSLKHVTCTTLKNTAPNVLAISETRRKNINNMHLKLQSQSTII